MDYNYDMYVSDRMSTRAIRKAYSVVDCKRPVRSCRFPELSGLEQTHIAGGEEPCCGSWDLFEGFNYSNRDLV